MDSNRLKIKLCCYEVLLPLPKLEGQTDDREEDDSKLNEDPKP